MAVVEEIEDEIEEWEKSRCVLIESDLFEIGFKYLPFAFSSRSGPV